MKTYKERTESILQKAEAVRQKKRKRIKLISILSSVACAVTLCVSLPIALANTDGAAMPPTNAGAPPEIKPPKPSIDKPTNDPPETNPPIDSTPSIDQGFASSGNGEPISTFMIAYKIDRQLDDGGDISVQLSFGEYRHNYDNNSGVTRVVVSVYNHDCDQTHVLTEVAAEQFFTPEYDVKIKHTIEENEYGELTTTGETRTFNHQENFTIPSNMFSKDKGVLVFSISAYDGDQYISGSGIQIHYVRRDGKIDILTYGEYKELEKADQTPPKTDITITPSN